MVYLISNWNGHAAVVFNTLRLIDSIGNNWGWSIAKISGVSGILLMSLTGNTSNALVLALNPIGPTYLRSLCMRPADTRVGKL